ncbi:hypothetical protein PR048_017922 [Dryococelus australis]|uniref:Uncharacterized protein n=1 Tax=Dryococelus australis TaxID=614101 RepID=A0ABQ9HB01_9NEOP|nr:hypothetical protein PR048_017922 [Dryococelus australis]
MEQRRNECTGETGDPRENLPTNGIVRHDSHLQCPNRGLNPVRLAYIKAAATHPEEVSDEVGTTDEALHAELPGAKVPQPGCDGNCLSSDANLPDGIAAHVRQLVQLVMLCRGVAPSEDHIAQHVGTSYGECSRQAQAAVLVRLLASHPFEPGSTPSGVAPGFSHVGIVPNDSTARRVFSGSLISPNLSFRRCSILTSLHSSSLKTSIIASTRKALNWRAVFPFDDSPEHGFKQRTYNLIGHLRYLVIPVTIDEVQQVLHLLTYDVLEDWRSPCIPESLSHGTRANEEAIQASLTMRIVVHFLNASVVQGDDGREWSYVQAQDVGVVIATQGGQSLLARKMNQWLPHRGKRGGPGNKLETIRRLQSVHVWTNAGIEGRRKREIPEKTRRPAASPSTIPPCENPGVTRLGIEPARKNLQFEELTQCRASPLSWCVRRECWRRCHIVVYPLSHSYPFSVTPCPNSATVERVLNVCYAHKLRQTRWRTPEFLTQFRYNHTSNKQAADIHNTNMSPCRGSPQTPSPTIHSQTTLSHSSARSETNTSRSSDPQYFAVTGGEIYLHDRQHICRLLNRRRRLVIITNTAVVHDGAASRAASSCGRVAGCRPTAFAYIEDPTDRLPPRRTEGGLFSRISLPPPHPLCIPALLHSHLISPLSALKTSLLRAAQISQHTSADHVDQTKRTERIRCPFYREQPINEVSKEQRRNAVARLGRGRGGRHSPRENPPTSGIVRYDSHVQKSGATPAEIKSGSPRWEASSRSAKSSIEPSIQAAMQASVECFKESPIVAHGLYEVKWRRVPVGKSGDIWTAVDVIVLRADEGEANEYVAAPEGNGGGKQEIPEKLRRPAASSGTIPTCENPGVTRQGIEPDGGISPRIELHLTRTTREHAARAAGSYVNNSGRCLAVQLGTTRRLTRRFWKDATVRQFECSSGDVVAAGWSLTSFRHCCSVTPPLALPEQGLAHLPPTTAIRVRSPAGSLPDLCMWESCWTMPLASGFSRGTPASSVLAFQRRSILGSHFMSCSGTTGALGSQLESSSLGGVVWSTPDSLRLRVILRCGVLWKGYICAEVGARDMEEKACLVSGALPCSQVKGCRETKHGGGWNKVRKGPNLPVCQILFLSAQPFHLYPMPGAGRVLVGNRRTGRKGCRIANTAADGICSVCPGDYTHPSTFQVQGSPWPPHKQTQQS